MLLGRRLTDERVRLGALVEHLGEHGIGLLLVALAAPAAIPQPIPLGGIFGVILILVGVQMVRSRRRTSLPGFLSDRTLKREHVLAVTRRAAALLRRLERFGRPRLQFLTGDGALPWLGPVVMFLGLLLLLPIPFGNTPVALSILLIGLGILLDDGASVIAGLVLGGITVAWFGALVGGGAWLAQLLIG